MLAIFLVRNNEFDISVRFGNNGEIKENSSMAGIQEAAGRSGYL
jgi:hypothetical protein